MLKFNVTAKSETDSRTIVTARDFVMTIDEPENAGGSNEGANPVEYVLAALCGCLNVMGHIVAEELGFVLNGLSIEVEGELDPAKLMGKPTQSRAGFTVIRVKLDPDCDVGKDTLDMWCKAVENRCPVSDNLVNATPVEICLG